ncbi:hypothetical protein [Haliangium sp.]|uniref:hypothetical protein n=1 Tax=Haliangium sp. TaxID=2663208 RepID=UPI003D0B1ABD
MDDHTGYATGLEISDGDLQKLGGLRAGGNIQPLPAMTCSSGTEAAPSPRT